MFKHFFLCHISSHQRSILHTANKANNKVCEESKPEKLKEKYQSHFSKASDSKMAVLLVDGAFYYIDHLLFVLFPCIRLTMVDLLNLSSF